MPTSPLTPDQQLFLDDMLARMTLEEKLGQMTQPEKNSVKPGDVARLGLGSVLSGGGGNPDPNTPQAWRDMVGGFLGEALQTRLRIPLLYGVDAVHGHNNVFGATIFPHNIGLGATRDADLLRRVGRATALEVCATGVRWTFAPAVSIPQDFRWGRSYEGYGQDPALVSELAVALIEGLRGEAWNSASSVLPSVKHYLADGATTWGSSRRVDRDTLATDRTLAIANMGAEFVNLLDQGAWQIDQGDAEVDEQTLRSLHLPPYRAATKAGALNVMVSYSSWKGLKMHAHAYLVNDLLKGELAFPGFVVSDWEGIDQIGPDYDACVVHAINAGIDMVMVPFDYERFLTSIHRAVDNGEVSLARIDDAVRRILTAKVALGLFARSELPALDVVGSEGHRDLAREAAGKSAVLLKNDGNVLPLDPNLSRLLVAGEAADDLGAHCGGWTVTWMGGHGAVTRGTTVLSGLLAELGADRVIYSPSGEEDESGADFPVGVVVLAEEPYAEGMGDRTDLRLSPDQLAVIARVRARCGQLVVVLLSGRPLIVTEYLTDWDAFVAGWLPGSEGHGLADVLLGLRPFTGRLSFDWPAAMRDLPRRADSEALYQAGAGLETATSVMLP